MPKKRPLLEFPKREATVQKKPPKSEIPVRPMKPLRPRYGSEDRAVSPYDSRHRSRHHHHRRSRDYSREHTGDHRHHRRHDSRYRDHRHGEEARYERDGQRRSTSHHRNHVSAHSREEYIRSGAARVDAVHKANSIAEMSQAGNSHRGSQGSRGPSGSRASQRENGSAPQDDRVEGNTNYYARDPEGSYPEGTEYSDDAVDDQGHAVPRTGGGQIVQNDRAPHDSIPDVAIPNGGQAHPSGGELAEDGGMSAQQYVSQVAPPPSYSSGGDLNTVERYEDEMRRRRSRDSRYRHRTHRGTRRYRHYDHYHSSRHPNYARYRRPHPHSGRHGQRPHSDGHSSKPDGGHGSKHEDESSKSGSSSSSKSGQSEEASGIKGKFTKRNILKGTLLALGTAAAGFAVKKFVDKRKEKKEEEKFHTDGTGFDETMYRPPLPKAGMFSVKVPQNQVCIVERGGKYHRKLNAGSNSLTPFVDNVAYCHSLKDMMIPVPKQHCYTKDNVSVKANGCLSFRIEDPVAASYGVDNPYRAVVLLSQTCLRSEIGQMTLDKAFRERGALSNRILEQMNDACRSWGVRITRFELRELEIPEEMKESLEREAEAERQKRLHIIQSEADREAAINRAEGQMQVQMKMSQARQMERVNQAIGEAHAIQERGEAIANAMRDVAEVVNTPGGEKAMQMRIAEQYIRAYGRAVRDPLDPPPDPNKFASSMNDAMGLLNTLGESGQQTAIPLADLPQNPFAGPANDPNISPPSVYPEDPSMYSLEPEVPPGYPDMHQGQTYSQAPPFAQPHDAQPEAPLYYPQPDIHPRSH